MTAARLDRPETDGESTEMLAARVNARVAMIRKESRGLWRKRLARAANYLIVGALLLAVLWEVRSLCRDDGQFLLVLGLGAAGAGWGVFQAISHQQKKITRLEERIDELEERQAAEARRRLAGNSRPPMPGNLGRRFDD
jgi:hypothetical protein